MSEEYHNPRSETIGFDLDVVARQYIREHEITALLGDIEIERAVTYFRNLWNDVQHGFGFSLNNAEERGVDG
jgi:hypothetical protein